MILVQYRLVLVEYVRYHEIIVQKRTHVMPPCMPCLYIYWLGRLTRILQRFAIDYCGKIFVYGEGVYSVDDFLIYDCLSGHQAQTYA